MGDVVRMPVEYHDHRDPVWTEQCEFLQDEGWESFFVPNGKSIIRVWKEPSGELTGKYGTQLAYDLARGGGPEGLRSMLDNGV